MRTKRPSGGFKQVTWHNHIFHNGIVVQPMGHPDQECQITALRQRECLLYSYTGNSHN